LKEFEGVKKVLVIKLSSIGDVLLTVPAIRAVKESLPSAVVSALVRSGTEEMLTLNPLLDTVYTLDESIKPNALKKRGSGELKLIKELREKGFDMAVDLTGGDGPAIIGCLIGARFRLGYYPEGAGLIGKKFFYTHVAETPEERTHAVLGNLALPSAFGLKTGNLNVEIFTTPDDDAFVEGLLKDHGIGNGTPYVHVHPASRRAFKCWTDPGMAAIMDLLHAEGLRVVLTSSLNEQEAARVVAIKALMKSEPVDLSSMLSLKHLASLSRGARLFFGVDTAPMHIGAATSTPVVAIFGPDSVFGQGPWNNEASTRTTPYAALNGVQTFGRHTAIQMDWECIPCNKNGCNDSKKSDCLEAMDTEFVWTRLRTVLDGPGADDDRTARAEGGEGGEGAEDTGGAGA
jgi:heptosyltransferase-3